MRDRKLLNSGWHFIPDLAAPAVVGHDEVKPPGHGWRPVVVPGFWQSQFRDLARSTGVGWYRTDVVLDDAWLRRESLTIEFGAVGHFCQGWLNGRYLGAHEGGHLPFAWSITDEVRPGRNELLVRVVSPSGDRSRFGEFPFEETLHGKQSWYGPTGGIWQEVAVEARAAEAITELVVEADCAANTVEIRADLAVEVSEASVRIDLQVLGPDGVVVAHSDAVAGETRSLDMGDHETMRWSPDAPALYRCIASVIVDGIAVDVTERRFGFRTFGADNGRFVLNGAPIMMRGVLDQDYWNDPGVPTSKGDIIERFELVKSMGFNTVRCHIKIPDPRYLDAADEVGLLVWCEMPTTSRLTRQARERFENSLTAMIARDLHHPCIVVWGIANESWGLDLTGSAEQRAWLHDLYQRTKALAPHRLIVDNSPCVPNFHIESDIEDYHFYAVIPEMRQRWNRFLDAFANRADFTYSPHGDAQRSGTEPLVVSEFGAWGLPDLTHLTDGDDREPWWFESGQEWADGAAYVHGAEDRFALWHLDAVFGSWTGLCYETQRRQFETLRYQIQTMRARPEIAGYVLTELGDVQWEANGLLDMTGRPRSFVDGVAAVNQSPTLIASVDRLTMWDDESVRIDLTAVNDAQTRRDVAVRCGLAGAGDTTPIPLGAVEPMGHGVAEPFVLTPGAVDVPRLVTVECGLLSDGDSVAEVSQPMLVVPRRGRPPVERSVAVIDDPELAERLRSMGYTIAEDDRSGLRITRRLHTDDHDFIEAGGRGLLLADDVAAFGDGFGEYPRIELRAWRDALFGGGEWVSAFSWLRRIGRFADLPGGPMMDSFFEGLTPSVVITGVPPARFEYDVYAGVFVGWVHQVAALIAHHHAGLGSLLISTLRLTEHPVGADPLADWLLQQLIATASEQQ